MGKVKEKFTQENIKEFELNLSYQEWLRDNFHEPSEDEINMMEQDYNKSNPINNQIIVTKPLNNKTYNPLKGA